MPSPLFENKKERTDFIIAILVVALFGTFMGFQLWNDNPLDDNLLQSELLANQSNQITPPLTTFQEDETTLVVPSTNKTRAETDIEDTTNEIEHLNIGDSLTLKEVVTEIKEQLDTSSIHGQLELESDTNDSSQIVETEVGDNTPKVNQEEEAASGEAITQEAETNDTATGQIDPPTTTVAPPSSTSVVTNVIDGKDCRIIVGAYQFKSSRDAMLQKLAKTNYQVVTYKENGLNIVAIHHTCDPEELRATVKVVRDKYADGAFVTGK